MPRSLVHFRYLLVGSLIAALAGCATAPPTAAPPTVVSKPAIPAGCPVCPQPEAPKPPAVKPMQAAAWADLPGWTMADPAPAFAAFLASCRVLEKRDLWQPVCAAARTADAKAPAALRTWFETWLRPWAMVNPDGSRTGLITGYYEPILQGSRKKSRQYPYPVFGPPDDLITVDLASLYPELKNLRLRGRLEGNKLVPYYDRAEWQKQESKRSPKAIAWVADAIDLFFMQIQGSGQIELADGSRIRLGYADQNGHPYRSIGRWLIDQNELASDEASMQGIKHWVQANPQRLDEVLNKNPSLVFFRELPMTGSGPLGAMGLPLMPQYSLAVDPRYVPLGAPVWLDTTEPNSEQALTRIMLAQDTGGAIRGAVRADFYWGSGPDAGSLAGKMRQSGRLWVLLPQAYYPSDAPN